MESFILYFTLSFFVIYGAIRLIIDAYRALIERVKLLISESKRDPVYLYVSPKKKPPEGIGVPVLENIPKSSE